MLVLLLVALVVVGSFYSDEEQADQSAPAPPPRSDSSDGKTYEMFKDGNPPKVKRQLRRAEEAAEHAVAAENGNTGNNKTQGTYTGGDTYMITHVIDGDTIDVAPGIDGTERVRLIGVDTPEVYGGTEPCGPEASAFTESRLEGEQVTLAFDEELYDPYHRILAYVYVDGQMFNETLVAEGYASVTTYPPNDRYEQRFIAAEAAAPTLACSAPTTATATAMATAPATAPAPATAAPSGGGVSPISEENCPPGAPIKGNESSSGELIYHTRSSATYDATHPEECFATELAAQAAGYRAAGD
jgi:micrococcal nuclease